MRGKRARPQTQTERAHSIGRHAQRKLPHGALWQARPVDDDLLRTIASLRATRRFTARAVDPGDVDRILEVARWTGSARNRQPWRLITLESPGRLMALSRLGAYALHVRGCPLAVLVAIDRERGGADAEFDAGRLAQNVMLAAHALGLGSCPVTLFPEENIAAATALAGLAAPWSVRTAIALGHPDTSPGPPGRPAIPRGRMSPERLRNRPAGD